MLPLQVLSSDPVLGALIISTCVIFITFVILTLFVSVILEAFGEEQENHQVLHESLLVVYLLLDWVTLANIHRLKCDN